MKPEREITLTAFQVINLLQRGWKKTVAWTVLRNEQFVLITKGPAVKLKAPAAAERRLQAFGCSRSYLQPVLFGNNRWKWIDSNAGQVAVVMEITYSNSSIPIQIRLSCSRRCSWLHHCYCCWKDFCLNLLDLFRTESKLNLCSELQKF